MKHTFIVQYANSRHKPVQTYSAIKEATAVDSKLKKFDCKGSIAATALPAFDAKASGMTQQEVAVTKEYETTEDREDTAEAGASKSIEPTVTLEPYSHISLTGVKHSTIITQSGTTVCKRLPMKHKCSIIIAENGSFISSTKLGRFYETKDAFTNVNHVVHKYKVNIYWYESVMKYDLKLIMKYLHACICRPL
jgi:hypothetical protein